LDTKSAPSPLPDALLHEHADGVDEFAVQVYEYVLGHAGAVREEVARALNAPRYLVDEAVGVLRGLRLVKDTAKDRDELVAVDPEAAQIELLVPLERAIHDSRRRLVGVKEQLHSFIRAFNDTRRHRPRGETVVVTDDPEEIGLRLAEAARRSTREILLMQPCVAQEHAELRQAHPLILEALQRGVDVRALYPHTARGDAGTRSRVRDLGMAGGAVRTSREVHLRCLVFDRDTAFIPADGVPGGVTIVYEPAVAAFLGGIHDLVWESAYEQRSGAVGYADTLDDLRATILELLASGMKDEVIARRIGLSERSFRRHVAAIMQDLAAGSRFQAGVMAAWTGLLSEPAMDVQTALPRAGSPGRDDGGAGGGADPSSPRRAPSGLAERAAARLGHAGHGSALPVERSA
jgi:DNA-binding CsgD family transcriptional regulator